MRKFNFSLGVATLLVYSHTSSGAFLKDALCYPSNGLFRKTSLLAASNDVPVPSTEDTNVLHRASYLRKFEQLQKFQREGGVVEDDSVNGQREELYREYASRSANSLKAELKKRKQQTTGRKPDLARRLADYDMQVKYGIAISNEEDYGEDVQEDAAFQAPSGQSSPPRRISKFAGLVLSEAAGNALGNAGFETPSPIQAASIPRLARGESLILQAETGSGKTLAYLLPVTEQLWMNKDHDEDSGFVVILTPTRELATQVAGVAAALAPKGSVRLVTFPSNLMPKVTSRESPTLFVGTAKCVMQSLYGDGVMPASPTPKPLAVQFLQNTRCLILDEVDRILNVKGSEKNLHEKPAAIVTAATMRQTLGRVQIVAASATVGRPLRRELARVLGLPPQECPPVVLARANRRSESLEPDAPGHVPRAITLPTTLENYIVAVNDTQTGKLLTTAYSVIMKLSSVKPRRMLLVLSKGFGINVQNSIGALKHFQCQPEPKSLLDVLQADNPERLMETYSSVSGAVGVGESLRRSDSDATNPEGYLLVTGEDSIRGLHFDGLDVVIVVGRPNGPDEYLHIAGRTGRAGRSGIVINIVSDDNAGALKSWEKMLGVEFKRIQLEDLTKLD